MKESYHNFRTSDDIVMKFEPITKLVKRNKTTSKNFDEGVILENCDVSSVIFLIYGTFYEAIPKSDSGVCKTYISIKSNLLS